MGYLQTTYAHAPRRACHVAQAQRTMIRYVRRPRADEGVVRERLRTLAAQHPRYGYRRLHVLLRRELGVINRKRIYRLYRLEGLTVRRRKRKRVTAVPRVALARPWQRGEAWAMDFMQDTLANGRRFRTLNVLDTVTRECLAIEIEVDTSLPGQRVVRVLEQLVTWYGAPKQITSDNGPEFAGLALDAWAYANSVTLDFIESGKPSQNGYLESFNGKFRDECHVCLNVHWFANLAHARNIIHTWKEAYNHERPHSALGQLAPAVFAPSLAT